MEEGEQKIHFTFSCPLVSVFSYSVKIALYSTVTNPRGKAKCKKEEERI